MDILQVENVSKSYSSHRALDNVSLSVPEGQVYGLLGPTARARPLSSASSTISPLLTAAVCFSTAIS